jgi:hypothetical protein
MGQRQVMLRVEKIDFSHLNAKIAIFRLTSVKRLDTFIQKNSQSVIIMEKQIVGNNKMHNFEPIKPTNN